MGGGTGRLLAVQLLRPSFGSVLITEKKNEKKQQESKAQNVRYMYVEHVSSESLLRPIESCLN